MTSRAGSRLATSLAEKGLIERERRTTNGRRTYLLTPTNGQSPSPSPATTSEGEPTDDATNSNPADALTPREARALALIQDRGRTYQSELWKVFEVSSRTGSRIATSLENNGVLHREEATYHDRRTYALKPVETDPDFSLLMAGEVMSPLVAADEGIDPIDSEAFAQWPIQLVHEKR